MSQIRRSKQARARTTRPLPLTKTQALFQRSWPQLRRLAFGGTLHLPTLSLDSAILTASLGVLQVRHRNVNSLRSSQSNRRLCSTRLRSCSLSKLQGLSNHDINSTRSATTFPYTPWHGTASILRCSTKFSARVKSSLPFLFRQPTSQTPSDKPRLRYGSCRLLMPSEVTIRRLATRLMPQLPMRQASMARTLRQ